MPASKGYSSPLSNKDWVIYGITADAAANYSLAPASLTNSTTASAATNTNTTTTTTIHSPVVTSMAMTLSETSVGNDDSSDDTSETSVLSSMSYVERRADWTDPRLLEHVLNVCMHKLQRVSYGRHECLSRQVQLSCMLHRLRMQSFQLQQQQLQQQPLVFDQDMSSLHSLDAISAYDWDQAATLGPNPLSSNLSLDMLLSMGSSSGSSDSQALSSSTNEVDQHDIFSLGPLPQQQNNLSSIPLVPFSGDYSASVGSSSPIALSSIPSLPTSSPSQDQPLATATALPQQTYYELLMAANPNEPLSQLLSTSATTMGPSSTYTTASPTRSSSAVEHPSAYAVLDSPGSSFATVSSSSAPTLVSQNTPSADHISTAFPLASIPISSSTDAQQQTVPLTTKEIMDALSGQFPIQPITASQPDLAVSVAESSSSQESFPVTLESPAYLSTSQALSSTEALSASETAAPLSPPLADTSVAAAVLAAIRAVETFSHVGSTNDHSSALVESDAKEQLGAVSTMSTVNATAPLLTAAALDLKKVSKKLEDMNTDGNTSNARSLLVARVTGVDAASDSAIPEDHSRVSVISNSHPEPVLEPEEASHTPTTLPSPTPAPAKASVRSRKSTRTSATQRRSSRASGRPYKERNVHSRNSESYEDVQDEDEHSSKRGRSSDEDASSSSCSSPESSPPSPKTPPPLTDTHSTAHEHDGHLVPGIKSLAGDHDHDHMLSHPDHGGEPKSLKRSNHPVCEDSVDAPAPKLRKKKMVRVRTAQSVDGEEPGDESDAGILSPSLLPRYSSSLMTTRRSARINRHRNQADLSEAHSLASSNVPRLVGGRANRPAVA
ncbi:hypothetical protein BGZ70_002689 [Mortierella alpina]|uniref:Uncharacterized protein n=1 Tax=Mortierella alpina TaxID=64518 RepID=A0A9P6IWW3_MORAP|nr:hypothetical protein BGZ70_002689 [Mortierella alpina]